MVVGSFSFFGVCNQLEKPLLDHHHTEDKYLEIEMEHPHKTDQSRSGTMEVAGQKKTQRESFVNSNKKNNETVALKNDNESIR